MAGIHVGLQVNDAAGIVVINVDDHFLISRRT
jgi:hypothetical protein